MLERLRDLADRNEDFAFETTLASRSFAPWIATLRREQDYRCTLFYLWVPAPEFSVNRVAGRVREGGHFVPAEVVERRFYGGIANFFSLYRPIADEWKVFDNSRGGQPLYLVAEGERVDLPIVYDQDLWERIQEDGRRERTREA
jgi:predicted ABC-type ATPase